MSTTEPIVTPEPTPPAPQTPADYQALYEAEQRKTDDLIRQRNLLKPAERLLNGIGDGSREAMMEFGNLVRAYEAARTQTEQEEAAQAIAEWNLQVAQQVSGKDMAALIAERQAREQRGEPEPTPTVPGLTEEQVRQIVADAQAADRNYQKGVDRVTSVLKDAGYDANSAAGRTIIGWAVDNEQDLPEAIQWFEKDVESTAMSRATAAAAAAAAAGAAVPQGAPQGSPVGKIPDGKRDNESDEDFRRRSVMAKLATIDVTN